MSEPESPNEKRKYTLWEWIVYGFWGFVLELLLTALSSRRDAATFLVLLLTFFILVSILVGMATTLIIGSFQPTVSDQVAQRIYDMENSIEALRSAENLMGKMKNDLEQAKVARKRIENDLETAEKLKDVTDEQVEAMAEVLKRQSWKDWWSGLVVGVVSALVSGVIVSVGTWFLRKRAVLPG